MSIEDLSATSTPIELVSTIGVLPLFKNMVVSEHYALQTDLTAEVRFENGKYVVVDYQLDEYGIGNSLQEAQQDFLDSLVGHLVSLEKREHRLADRELRKLQLLRNMLTSRKKVVELSPTRADDNTYVPGSDDNTYEPGSDYHIGQ